MPVLDVDGLKTSLCSLRRAHVVLAFLTHFYAHTTIAPNPVEIPACLGVPLLAVSDLLGLPPVLTYADTVLYNFHAAASSSALSLTANPPTYTLASFTNTRSEQQFYIISALCEIAGSEALRLMRRSLDELFLADQTALRRLTLYLKKLAVQIDRIGDITLSIMKEVDPEEFYHLIRPWFKGGDSEGPESLGWLFMGADDQAHAAENVNRGERKGRMFSGPSAGQSSLIHAIDIFLTVDHSPTEDEAVPLPQQPVPALHLNHSPIAVESTEQVSAPAPTAPTRPAGNNEASFVQRMLQYMPLPHRTFLLHLSTHPTPLRPLVIAHAQSHPHLAAAYDSALEALKRFREKHMRVVSMFIVQQARRKPSPRIRRLLGEEVDEDEEDQEVVAKETEKGELRGTGGTPLFKFLKRCRDNTTKAMIGTSAGPSYELE
jgi:indoleamine 2,3-dioxygenase